MLFDFFCLCWDLLNWYPVVTMVILCVFSETGSVFLVEYDFLEPSLTIKGLFLMLYTLDCKTAMLKSFYSCSLENSLM